MNIYALKKITCVFFLGTCLLSICKGQPYDRKGKDFALLFAINNYEDRYFNDLSSPIRDLSTIKEILDKVYGFSTILYKNTEKQEILDIIKEWQQRKFEQNTQLFIFFSGHGTFNDFYKQGYLIPQDGKYDNFDSYLELGLIENIVTQISCDHILLAIDACYSGTIDRKIAFRDGDWRRPNINNVNQMQNLITNYLQFKSRLLVTSGGKERVPDAGSLGGHSPFSQVFIEGLRRTVSSDYGIFSFRELLANLEKITPIPHYGELLDHENGSFVFVVENPIIKSNGNKIGNDSPNPIDNYVKDSQGNTYPIKKLPDGRYWMTKNLNFETPNSYCYDRTPNYCNKYGRLYTLNSAKEGCSSLGPGWKIPTDNDWKSLLNSFNGGYHSYPSMEHIGNSKLSYNALTVGGVSSFDATLGGYLSNGKFSHEGMGTAFWTSSKENDLYVYFRFIQGVIVTTRSDR